MKFNNNQRFEIGLLFKSGIGSLLLIAQKGMEKAEKYLNEGKPDKAIDHYKKAWEHAQQAIKFANKDC